MDRLHEKGYISHPRSKARSVVFTEEGLEQARRLLEMLFGKHA
jgi:Mn-dependent DtxR family transcriptional regulator